MRVLTLTELMRLSKIELYHLLALIANALRDFPEGSAERANAVLNLGNIRWVLARRHDFSPLPRNEAASERVDEASA
jgi:hypothetical protein